MSEIILPKGLRGKAYQEGLKKFADSLIELDNQMPNPVSARGWCYILEGMNLITKDQFNYVEKIINKCRKLGLLPLDFTATDKRREFQNVEVLQEETLDPISYLLSYVNYVKDCHEYKKDKAFWETQEEYYLQIAVEKVDLLYLFDPICEKYHIPIANMVGWSDLNSRGNMAKRFKEAEEELGLKPILLYYGDFDPGGIQISDFLKENLDQLKKATHWDPKNLVIDRFGLEFDFIENNNLLWIDNLITSSGRNLGTLYQKHLKGEKTNLAKYEIEYIKKYGVRKCEANAVLPISEVAIKQCEDKILEYLGDNCFEKYDEKITEIQNEVKDIMDKVEYRERFAHLIVDLKALKEDLENKEFQEKTFKL